jgi:ABC-type hemin transport system substrate-binding protein
MMKKLAFALAPILAPLAALSACADEPEAVPRPDPALVERIAVANTAETEAAEKLGKADKLVGAVAHVEPDRVAGAAEKLLAR